MKNGMSGKVADYCSDHWHKATLVNYGYKLNHWLDFNKHISQGPLDISHQKVMDFLIYLFEERQKTMHCEKHISSNENIVSCRGVSHYSCRT